MAVALFTASGFDRSAIMHRAWNKARHYASLDARAGRPVNLRQSFAEALRYVWDEARGCRAMAIWRAEQEAAQAAPATLDARTRAIADLRFERFAANGIGNTREHLAAVRRIDARLLELRA